jgi:ParB/RepB/Spo0J family partition protein
MAERPDHYMVIAGHRRLAALREIHKGDGDPKIPCVLRDVDADTADALSLGENFAQQAMHPLDEAEAFASLAAQDGKDAACIGAEFGVSKTYVLQRTKLASLAPVVKSAYRAGEIDTATAEAFASVPDEKQVEVWTELNGCPRHADHVRNVIGHGWIDAKHALFDVSTLPDWTVSRDLFSETVRVERAPFMSAQLEAMGAERERLIEEGWREVVAGRFEDVGQLPSTMDRPQREYDAATTATLERLAPPLPDVGGEATGGAGGRRGEGVRHPGEDGGVGGRASGGGGCGTRPLLRGDQGDRHRVPDPLPRRSGPAGVPRAPVAEPVDRWQRPC